MQSVARATGEVKELRRFKRLEQYQSSRVIPPHARTGETFKQTPRGTDLVRKQKNASTAPKHGGYVQKTSNFERIHSFACT